MMVSPARAHFVAWDRTAEFNGAPTMAVLPITMYVPLGSGRRPAGTGLERHDGDHADSPSRLSSLLRWAKEVLERVAATTGIVVGDVPSRSEAGTADGCELGHGLSPRVIVEGHHF